MKVRYAFYDMDENGELKVLKNKEYNESIASLVDNLRGIEETLILCAWKFGEIAAVID